MKELKIAFTVNELNIVLEALGSLPYVKVYELIGQVQHQAREQLNGSAAAAGLRPEPQDTGASLAKAEIHTN